MDNDRRNTNRDFRVEKQMKTIQWVGIIIFIVLVYGIFPRTPLTTIIIVHEKKEEVAQEVGVPPVSERCFLKEIHCPEEAPIITVKIPENKQKVAEALIKTLPEEDPNVVLAVFTEESRLRTDVPSSFDTMKDGRAFSWGVAQINLTQHNINGVPCHTAFKGKNYDAEVIDEALYVKCIELATDLEESLKMIRKIYDGRGGKLLAWGAYTSNRYKKHL